MDQAKNRYALILAGGSGTRFWPVSRDSTPKQLLSLFGEQSLLAETVARLEGLVPLENILVLTNHVQEAKTRENLPHLPPGNIFSEPEKRDTAPAIALGIGLIAARNPAATMMVLPADHLVKDRAAFHAVLRGACEYAEVGEALVTIGIKPTWACPSYGYIERGRRVQLPGVREEVQAYEVVRFREKPNAELAETFVQQGAFSWNAGMFIWTIASVLSELTRHCPELADFVKEVRTSADIPATVARQFGKLPRISVDYALMERASRVINIEATFDWDDVGSWTSVGKYFSPDAQENHANVPVTAVEAHHNIVYAQSPAQHIALLGVHDLIVVQTGDALLIARADMADKIKKIAEQVPRELH